MGKRFNYIPILFHESLPHIVLEGIRIITFGHKTFLVAFYNETEQVLEVTAFELIQCIIQISENSLLE